MCTPEYRPCEQSGTAVIYGHAEPIPAFSERVQDSLIPSGSPILLVVSYASTDARHLLVDKLANRPHVLA